MDEEITEFIRRHYGIEFVPWQAKFIRDLWKELVPDKLASEGDTPLPISTQEN
jgi:hypothetical protein